MKVKGLVLGLISILTMNFGSYAKEDVTFKKNYSTGKIQITAVYNEGEQAAIQILPSNISLEGFAQSADKENKIVYTNFDVADKSGICNFEAKIKDSGNYSIYICGENSDEITKKDFVFYSNEKYKAVIDELNSKSSESDFADFIAENMEELGFETDVDDNLDIKSVGKQMYKELNSRKLLEQEFEENAELYTECAVIVSLNGSKCTNICDALENIIESDETLKKYADKYLSDENTQKYFTGKLSNINITSVSDLKTKIKKALVLTVTRYPDGYMSIKNVLDTYKSEYGLKSVTSKDSVYKDMAANDYSFNTFIETYNRLSIDFGSSSSGGTSSGGGRVSNSSNISGITTGIDGNTKTVEKLKIKFDDLGSADWAYASVSKLFELGIVNGYNENEFMPQANVKREEFVKMILSAIGVSEFETLNLFVDAEDGAWYTSYVNTAYKLGIVNGIGENKFGIGDSITRQDMAVIIYNAIKNKNAEYKDSSFKDADEIDDYAKNAVNILCGLAIINGVGDDCFAPKQNATRAEAAVIIDRALSYIK